MMRIEFENTKQKEDAESIGAALPVTQMEKWLSDTEMPDGVCMLSMTRKILEEGVRKDSILIFERTDGGAVKRVGITVERGVRI